MPDNKKIRCVVVDDEPPAREMLKLHISGVESLELCGTFSNAVEVISFLKNNRIDLLFLDIQMPQLLGTDFIRTLKSPPKIIFTTAYRKYAVEGFELDAVDYILKPISFGRFLKAVNKVLQTNLENSHSRIPVKEKETDQANTFLYFRVDRKMIKVFFNDILYIEGMKDYIKIVTPTKTIVTKYLISALEKILPTFEFLRIHKSYIIAINKIESYNAETVQIADHELPIGRVFKHDVTKALNASSAS